MLKNRSFAVRRTSLYHYDLYVNGWVFLRKIGNATVNLEESKVSLCFSRKWEKYAIQISKAVATTHFLLKELYQNQTE